LNSSSHKNTYIFDSSEREREREILKKSKTLKYSYRLFIDIFQREREVWLLFATTTERVKNGIRFGFDID
jgi:hypothetical protein